MSEQHRAARPQGREASDKSDDGLQIVLKCVKADRWKRDHELDQEGAAAQPQLSSQVRSGPALQPGFLIFFANATMLDSSLSMRHNRTNSYNF